MCQLQIDQFPNLRLKMNEWKTLQYRRTVHGVVSKFFKVNVWSLIKSPKEAQITYFQHVKSINILPLFLLSDCKQDVRVYIFLSYSPFKNLKNDTVYIYMRRLLAISYIQFRKTQSLYLRFKFLSCIHYIYTVYIGYLIVSELLSLGVVKVLVHHSVQRLIRVTPLSMIKTLDSKIHYMCTCIDFLQWCNITNRMCISGFKVSTLYHVIFYFLTTVW